MRQETIYVEPQSEKREGGDRYIRERISKHNTGHFYVSLHRALFGGQISPKYRGQHESLDSGQLINGDPDIFREQKYGTDIVEVKSASWADKRPSFTPEQVRNHSYKYLQRLLDYRDISPDLELALYLFWKKPEFQDKHGKRKKNYPFLWGDSSSKATSKLCENTYCSIIFPSNIFYALMLSLTAKELDKTSSKSQTKGVHMNRPESGTISSLISSNNPLEMLISGLNSTEHENSQAFKKGLDMLRIGETKFKDYSSSDISDLRIRVVDGKQVNSYQVKPFPIRQFYLPSKEKEAWLTDFKENHRILLEDILGVPDLYFEQNTWDTYERPDHLRSDWDKIEENLPTKPGELPF